MTLIRPFATLRGTFARQCPSLALRCVSVPLPLLREGGAKRQVRVTPFRLV